MILHKRASQLLCNQSGSKWGNYFRLGTVNDQIKEGLGNGQGLSSVGSSGRDYGSSIEGNPDKGLKALLDMDREGTVPSALLVKRRLLPGNLGEYLVSTLVKCGSLEDALQVFYGLPQRTALSWTAVIAGYVTRTQSLEALRMYQRMQAEGVEPTSYTFVCLLRACGNAADFTEGKRIHAELLKYKYEKDMFVGNALLDMYGKCGSLVHSQNVFAMLPQRDVVTWTVMLAAYAEQGEPEKALQLYETMLEKGVDPDARTFVCVLQACGFLAEKEAAADVDAESTRVRALEMGKAVHAAAQRKGYGSDVFVVNTLVSMYGKCGSIVNAQRVFNELARRTVVSWNAMLAAYNGVGQAKEALLVYEKMRGEGVSPNQRTSVSVFQAIGMLAEGEGDVLLDGHATKVEALKMGKTVHADTMRRGHSSLAFVGNTLVSMYGKCGSVGDARHVFDTLCQRDVVSWNVMLAAYMEQGQGEMALHLYRQMCEQDVSPNRRSFVSVLSACGVLAKKEQGLAVDGLRLNPTYLSKGRAIHAEALRKGLLSDIFVGSSLINLYGNCGAIGDSLEVFNGLSQRDNVAWNALLCASVDQGQPERAMQLYGQMQEDGVSPDAWTFVCALQACGSLSENETDVIIDGRPTKVGALQKGRVVHGDVCRMGYCTDVFVGSTLVCMYGKCGSLSDAERVFKELPERDVVAWTTMFTAYVEQDQAERALRLYRQMQQLEGIIPDEITLQCILQACSKTGSLATLRQIHQALVSTGKPPSPALANALIHAYGRCCSMTDAQAVFDGLAQPDVVSWTALVAGYARQGHPEASLECYEKMQASGVKPNGVTFLSLLSACSHAGWVDKGVEYFGSMSRDHGVSPEIDHYVSMVDLLGRAGCFTRIEDLLATMPVQPNLAMWLCLLGVCRKHGKVRLGEQAFECAVRLWPDHSAMYTLMSNIYADAGLLDLAKKVRQQGDEWKQPGQSWIECDQDVATFLVGDHKQTRHKRLHDFVTTTNTICRGSA